MSTPAPAQGAGVGGGALEGEAVGRRRAPALRGARGPQRALEVDRRQVGVAQSAQDVGELRPAAVTGIAVARPERRVASPHDRQRSAGRQLRAGGRRGVRRVRRGRLAARRDLARPARGDQDDRDHDDGEHDRTPRGPPAPVHPAACVVHRPGHRARRPSTRRSSCRAPLHRPRSSTRSRPVRSWAPDRPALSTRPCSSRCPPGSGSSPRAPTRSTAGSGRRTRTARSPTGSPTARRGRPPTSRSAGARRAARSAPARPSGARPAWRLNAESRAACARDRVASRALRPAAIPLRASRRVSTAVASLRRVTASSVSVRCCRCAATRAWRT